MEGSLAEYLIFQTLVKIHQSESKIKALNNNKKHVQLDFMFHSFCSKRDQKREGGVMWVEAWIDCKDVLVEMVIYIEGYSWRVTDQDSRGLWKKQRDKF